MTICGAANFHPAKPTARSSGTPILRRAAYSIAVIAHDRKGNTLLRIDTDERGSGNR
jgi:hypothetical protein